MKSSEESPKCCCQDFTSNESVRLALDDDERYRVLLDWIVDDGGLSDDSKHPHER